MLKNSEEVIQKSNSLKKSRNFKNAITLRFSGSHSYTDLDGFTFYFSQETGLLQGARRKGFSFSLTQDSVATWNIFSRPTVCCSLSHMWWNFHKNYMRLVQ